jgi:NSS family neurotransmitter:Na+ symporter
MGSLGTVFGILFFICLVFAGLTSCVSLTEAFSAAVIDKTGFSRKKIVTLAVLGGYLISIFYATGAGLYFLDIIDAFINSYSIVVVGLLQSIIVGWFIGAHVIREHTNSVSLFSVGKWWEIMIKFVTPTVLIFMLGQSIVREIKSPYGDYPMDALFVFGWGVIALIIILSILLSKRPWKNKALELPREVE